MTEAADILEDITNPLDSVEEILSANDWTFDRPGNDIISVHVSGRMGKYRMVFIWQENYSAMQFCCELDVAVHADNLAPARHALSKINADLWLGHFDIPEKSGIPRFRHASLFRGLGGCSGADHVQDLIDIAMVECERYYPLFDLLSRAGVQDMKDISLALMDSAGES